MKSPPVSFSTQGKISLSPFEVDSFAG